jgi:hypothetical protein
MTKDSETYLIVAVVLVALWFLFLRKKKVVVAATTVLPTKQATVSVGGSTITGGLANSSLIQAGVLGVAAAPAVGGLFSSLFGSWSSTPAVAGNAPATGYDDTSYDTNGALSDSDDSSGLDLLS